MIPNVFIQNAADILAATNGGLSTAQVVKLCASYAIDFNVNAARKSKVDDNTARMQSIKQLGV